jgi:alpha-glucosidase
VQDADPTSVLNFTRALIAARRELPALVLGEIEILSATEQILAFRRVYEGQKIICLFNLSREPAVHPIRGTITMSPLEIGPGGWGLGQGGITLKPLSAFVGLE